MRSDASEDRGLLDNALWGVLGSGVVLSLASAYWFGVRGALGSAIGALLATLNLWVVARIVRNLLGDSRTRSRWGMLAVFKFGILIAVGFALITHGVTPVLPLALGYGALPIGIVLAQFWTAAPVEDKS